MGFLEALGASWGSLGALWGSLGCCGVPGHHGAGRVLTVTVCAGMLGRQLKNENQEMVLDIRKGEPSPSLPRAP